MDYLAQLRRWPGAAEAALDYIEAKNGDCKVILQDYHKKLGQAVRHRTPIIGGSAQQTKESRSWKWYLKKGVKACVPYGVLRLYQKKHYPNGI